MWEFFCWNWTKDQKLSLALLSLSLSLAPFCLGIKVRTFWTCTWAGQGMITVSFFWNAVKVLLISPWSNLSSVGILSRSPQSESSVRVRIQVLGPSPQSKSKSSVKVQAFHWSIQACLKLKWPCCCHTPAKLRPKPSWVCCLIVFYMKPSIRPEVHTYF